MIKITENWVWINGVKYECLSEDIIETKRIFATNHFYNGETHGGNAIRLEKLYEHFINFFNLNVDKRTLLSLETYEEEKDFIILKKDLDRYIIEVKDKFKNPPGLEEYEYFAEGENQKDYESIKHLINEDFEKLKDEYKNIKESFFEFKMYFKKDKYNMIYLLPEKGEVEKYFAVLRLMVIPFYSYFHVLKLKKNNKIVYYFKIKTDKVKTFERLVNDPKELIIDSDTEKQLWASLNANQNIILTGVPGTGKTHLATITAKEVVGECSYVLTTATSDWTTFDTIGGLIPKDDGQLVFREGKFLQAIRENKWLIIDEINRADIDKAFGQLFTVLSGQDVELPYYIKNKNVKNKLIPIKIKSSEEYDSFYDEGNATYYIGKNWRIIATMNSYDKNALFDLSYAFMRRFIIIEVGVPNNLEEFIKKLKNEDDEILYDKFSEGFTVKLEKLYEINTKYDEIDRKLGPAIFLDILKYLYYRMELEGDKGLDENNKYDYRNKIFSEALIAYVIPQFEGLGSTQREKVVNFIVDVFDGEDSSLVIDKLNDMKSYFN